MSFGECVNGCGAPLQGDAAIKGCTIDPHNTLDESPGIMLSEKSQPHEVLHCVVLFRWHFGRGTAKEAEEIRGCRGTGVGGRGLKD